MAPDGRLGIGERFVWLREGRARAVIVGRLLRGFTPGFGDVVAPVVLY